MPHDTRFQYRTLKKPMTCRKCNRRMAIGEGAVGEVGKDGNLLWVRCWEDFVGYFWLNYKAADIRATRFDP